jgi:membrane-bound lytic murein transglycosylase F
VNPDFSYLKNKFIVRILTLVSVLLLTSCGQGEDDGDISLSLPDGSSSLREQVLLPTSLERIKSRGELIIITTNTPTTYYFDRDNQLVGPEYDMTQAFAASLQVDVVYKVYDSVAEVLQALRDHEGDIAAAGLTVTDGRKIEFSFSSSYQKTNEYLVCHRNVKQIRDKEDLKTVDIVIAAGSSYVESIKAYPDAKWTAVDNISTVGLIEQVASKKTECTISDSTLYNIERRYHTEIQKKYTLAKESDLAWVVNKHNDDLLQAINDWFETYKDNNDLAYILEKYYGFVQIFDYVDTHKFLSRSKTRLPQYKDFFIDAANKNDISPSLLASQSYQESHWNRKAKSPTGVRGIMMLTQPVAKSLGVTNRLHAEQNIYAGAKFQAKMKKMVEHVDEPGRSWLALAAYNVGRGHFRDAQSLARKLGKNPDHWHDMKEVLPLLAQKKYYKDLRYGYARGNEPVRYVTRIRNYDSLLNEHFSDKFK